MPSCTLNINALLSTGWSELVRTTDLVSYGVPTLVSRWHRHDDVGAGKRRRVRPRERCTRGQRDNMRTI